MYHADIVVKKKTRKCDCGICRDVNTKCKCTKKFSHVHFKKCRKERKEKGVVQTKCCVFRRDCNGKKCRFHKLKCKWTGFERVSRVVFKCKTRKISKTASKRFCCKWKRTCLGLKCKNGKKKCKFVGLEITKKKLFTNAETKKLVQENKENNVVHI